MKLFIVVALLQIICAHDLKSTKNDDKSTKRSYVCPPRFIRQGHRCYFFSKQPASWQEAYFTCREKRSNLAVVKNPYQDKLIRNFLNNKGLDTLERWIGGVYDWGKQAWKWAASGKPLNYNGFGKVQKEENFRWRCIIMDPSLDYRWSSRTCVDKKHFICMTKMRVVDNKDKKRLQRQYNTNKFNKLNEIPVPNLPEYNNTDPSPLKSNLPLTYSYKFEINQSLNDQAQFGTFPQPVTKKMKKNNRRNKKKNAKPKFNYITYENGTVVEVPRKMKKSQKDLNNLIGEPTSIKNIRWRTYKKEGKRAHPFYPKPIVEEYNYIRTS